MSQAVSEGVKSSVGGQKRGSSDANPARHPLKRRAWLACQYCRERKVRCNVMQGGVPCTNCAMDGYDCKVSDGRRDNRRHDIGRDSSKTRLSRPRLPSQQPALNGSSSAQEHVGGSSWEQQFYQGHSADGTSPNKLSEGQKHPYCDRSPNLPISPSSIGDVDHAGYSNNNNNNNHEYVLERNTPFSQHPGGNSTKSTGRDGENRARKEHFGQDRLSPSSVPRLPNYIRPLPSELSEDDVEYLGRKKALKIPSPQFRDALIESFIDYAYPFLPLIDIDDLLLCLGPNDEDGPKLSLFVLQALMFAGSAFVRMDCLKREGFSTRKAAQKLFFQKAKLLYDLDCEQDGLALIQGLLLISSWYENAEDQKDSWHWLGLAISHCHSLGLHNLARVPGNNKSTLLRKRVWWSLFMQDRLTALAMKRSTRIKCEDCDVDMLKVEDFPTIYRPGSTRLIAASLFLNDTDLQRQLAALCIAKARLCMFVGPVLLIHQPYQREDSEGRLSPPFEGINTTDNHAKFQVEKLDMALDKWSKDLSIETSYKRPNTDPFDSCLAVHQALLRMLFFLIRLYSRRQSLDGRLSRQLDEERHCTIKRLRISALEIARLCEDVEELDLVRFLPRIAVTVVLLAAITHLHDLDSNDAKIQKRASQRLENCVGVIHGLQDIYVSADVANLMIETELRNVKAAGLMDSIWQMQSQLVGNPNDPSAILETQTGIYAPSWNDNLALMPNNDFSFFPPTSDATWGLSAETDRSGYVSVDIPNGTTLVPDTGLMTGESANSYGIGVGEIDFSVN